MILDLWQRLSSRRRTQFFLILGLMLFASLAEVITVGAILPFLAILTTPERVFNHELAQPFIQLLNVTSAEQLLLPITLLFCFAALFAGAIRILLLYSNTRYSYAVGADLSMDIYRRTLYQPYSVHISRNSSEVINGIVGKTAMMIGSVLVPLLTLISSSIILICLLFALLTVDAVIASTAAGVFAVIYWLITFSTKNRLKANSECISHESTQVIKSLQEGLGGIRDVLIDGTQETFYKIYRRADRPLRLAQGNNTFISASPRYVIESLGMIMIAVFAFWISQREGSLDNVIPVLGALALGAQRLLPMMQQGYSSIANIRGAQNVLHDTLKLLDQPLPESARNVSKVEPISFTQEITLKHINFQYQPDTKNVLNDVNLSISKGKRIGFIGKSGCGKSTISDIIMGLLTPTGGSLEIDGIAVNSVNVSAWQAHVAHVPQSIYLSDSSIQENIAFGVAPDDIDFERVVKAVEQAQLSEMIESWPDKYLTPVGERGVRISGGQRQRIGIARALYKQADVIIFDEATSALDEQTETSVMRAIDALAKDLTIIIIAHRLTTLRKCDLIVELENGQIKQMGHYDKIINAHKVIENNA